MSRLNPDIGDYAVSREDLHFYDLSDGDCQLFSDPCVSNVLRKPDNFESMLEPIDGMSIHSVFIRKIDDDNYIFLYIYSDLIIHMQMYEGLHALGSGMSPNDYDLKRAYSRAVSAYFDHFEHYRSFDDI
jgi:hypothetical protein